MTLRIKITPTKKATATMRRTAMACRQPLESPTTQPNEPCCQLPDAPPRSPKEARRQEPFQPIPLDVERINAPKSTPPTPVNTPAMVPRSVYC